MNTEMEDIITEALQEMKIGPATSGIAFTHVLRGMRLVADKSYEIGLRAGQAPGRFEPILSGFEKLTQDELDEFTMTSDEREEVLRAFRRIDEASTPDASGLLVISQSEFKQEDGENYDHGN